MNPTLLEQICRTPGIPATVQLMVAFLANAHELDLPE